MFRTLEFCLSSGIGKRLSGSEMSFMVRNIEVAYIKGGLQKWTSNFQNNDVGRNISGKRALLFAYSISFFLAS